MRINALEKSLQLLLSRELNILSAHAEFQESKLYVVQMQFRYPLVLPYPCICMHSGILFKEHEFRVCACLVCLLTSLCV